MRYYCFDDYVGDAEFFLSEYFNKRAFLRRQALAGRLEDIQSMIDLDGILALEALPPSYLRVSKNGIGVPSKSYRRITNRRPTLSEAIAPDKVYDLFNCGATITWNALHHVVPSVRRLITPFGDTFGCDTEVGLFVTPAENRGLAPHCDSLDIFVVQVYGSKTWKVWATPGFRTGNNVSYSLDELGESVLEETLEPGDVLYLPYGTPHAATAQRELSAHLSIGVEPRRWRHLLQETVEKILADDLGFHGFPFLESNAASGAAIEFEKRLAMLIEVLQGVDAGTELRRLAVAGRNKNGTSRREFDRLRNVDNFNEDTSLRRCSAEVRIGERAAGRVNLTVGDVQVSVPENLITALEALEWGRTVKASRFLAGAGVSRSVHAAQGLARLGLLEVAEESRDADVSG